MDTNILRNAPEKVAPESLEETPHACMGGWVFLGFEDEDGDEVIEAVPCRRCSETR